MKTIKTETKKAKIIDVLQNIHANKVILPSIQRKFVWTKQQVMALFDSIMLGYPISTFLFWNLNDIDLENNSYFYTFLKEATFNFQGKTGISTSALIESKIIITENTVAVLDGQQRLTSLFIALMGQTKTKAKNARQADTQIELYLDLSSGVDFFNDEEFVGDENDNFTKDSQDSRAYTFNFQLFPSTSKIDRKTWFKVKDIFKFKNIRDIGERESKIEELLSSVDHEIHKNAKESLNLMIKRIFEEEIINIWELSQCELDEALEIFIRFNSFGTKLSKADLVFSTIQSRWQDAKEKIDEFLKNINELKYNFTQDFIVRLALVLFGKPINIQKSRIENDIVKELKDHWPVVAKAIKETINFLSKECGVTSNREIGSYVAIIPIVYSVYNNDCQVQNKEDIKKYIYRSFILNIFSSYTNSRLVELKKIIMNNEFLITMEDIESKISDFKIGDEKIEQILEYEKSPTTQLTLFLMGNNNVFHSRDGSEYHQDHIHASAIFDDENNKPSVSDPTWMQWKKIKDKLPNLQLLKGKPNQSKSKKQLIQWLGSDNAPTENEFRTALNLPPSLSLKLFDFDEFYNCRKDLLKAELKKMLL